MPEEIAGPAEPRAGGPDVSEPDGARRDVSAPDVPAPDVSEPDVTETAILDAAAACVLAFGVRRTSLSDVARRAGVSRPTVYRRWPDLRALVADLMTRELATVFAGASSASGPPAPGPVRQQAVSEFLAAAR